MVDHYKQIIRSVDLCHRAKFGRFESTLGLRSQNCREYVGSDRLTHDLTRPISLTRSPELLSQTPLGSLQHSFRFLAGEECLLVLTFPLELHTRSWPSRPRAGSFLQASLLPPFVFPNSSIPDPPLCVCVCMCAYVCDIAA